MEQMIEKEIARVKNLKCNSTKSPWIIDPCPKNILYIDDDLLRINGIGEETKKSLYKHKIKCVGDLKKLTKTKQKTMVNIPALSNFIAIAKGCKNEKCPHKVTNYKKKANPYKAKFGNDWKMHIKKQLLSHLLFVLLK